MDVWNEQRTEFNKAIETLTKRLDMIRERSNQLTEAFVYDKSIDRETYQEQLLVEMELNESKVDEFDVQSAVNFAFVCDWRCFALLA